MTSNLDKYKKDLEQLILDGEFLFHAIHFECYPKEYKSQVKKTYNEKYHSKLIKNLPSFKEKYQYWYTESLSIIKLLLPDRMNDFVKLYEKPKGRKEIKYGNYVIEDYLQGLTLTASGGGMYKEKVVGPDAAIPQFQQQLNILKSVKRRFESSLFDIKQLVQADLFDSELDAAKELNKKGFTRGAGAVAGVVLERHLSQACDNHKIKVTKKNPTINDFNQLLKDNEVIEISTWRFIQHLADLRNLCDHKKKIDPKTEDIDELIEGVGKVTKTLF
jgi:hypothetical protein